VIRELPICFWIRPCALEAMRDALYKSTSVTQGASTLADSVVVPSSFNASDGPLTLTWMRTLCPTVTDTVSEYGLT